MPILVLAVITIRIGDEMKIWFTLAILLVSQTVLAKPKVISSFTRGDRGLGEIKVVVTDVIEPAMPSLLMTVAFRCHDKPAWEYIYKDEPICFFSPAPYNPDYNAETKILVLHYTVSPFSRAQKHCNKDLKQKLDLKVLCANASP